MNIMTQQQMVELHKKHLGCPYDFMGCYVGALNDQPDCDICKKKESETWFVYERSEVGPVVLVCQDCLKKAVNAEVDKKKEIEQDREWDAAASGGESRKYE